MLFLKIDEIIHLQQFGERKQGPWFQRLQHQRAQIGVLTLDLCCQIYRMIDNASKRHNVIYCNNKDVLIKT